MSNLNIARVAGLILSLLVFPASGQNLVLHAGIGSGGDELATAFFTDGDTESIDAGGLIHIGAGLLFPHASEVNPGWETQVTVEWKFDSIDADNGDISWDRMPLNLTHHKRFETWRIGGGLTYHLSPSLEGTGLVNGLNVDFDDALGVLVEFDVIYNTHAWIGARFTSIDYEVSGVTVDGNSVDVIVGYAFP